MGTHRHRTRPLNRRPRHARPAPWWPPILIAGSAAAVIPGDTVGGLLLGVAVLIVFTALAAARRVLNHAAVHVSLILAEELADPGSLSTRG
ncbi:hypothetical protein [Amycolatopsis sp. cmx-4-68]|uniref:hypothetical protein n=1 Tax=Amycolatopsis sp. cmx-4-68 TaxID=2790938 RepID=UPI00397D6ACB